MAINLVKRFLLGLAVSVGLVGCTGDADEFLQAIELAQLQIQSLEISSLRNRSQRGESLNYSAQAVLAAGNSDFTSRVDWGTSNPAVASITSAGVVSALTSGEVQITARFGNLLASSVLTINDATLQQLALTAGSTVDVCKASQLGATGSYSDGSSREIRDLVDWSVNAGSSASIENSGATKGTILATDPKQVTVTLNKESLSRAALVSVLDTLSSISVTANTSGDLAVNAERQYTATGSYTGGAGNVEITNNVNWASSVSSVASISASGLLKGLSIGSTTVTASCGGNQSTPHVAAVTDSAKDTLQFLLDSNVVTSVSRSNDNDFNLKLQSVSSSNTKTDRTEAAQWSIRSSDAGVTVSVNNADNSKGQLTISGVGSFIVQAVFNETAVILPVEIETLTPPSAPG